MADGEQPPERRGFGHFWTTLPGVLTAIAGLVTAGVSAYLALKGPPDPKPTPNGDVHYHLNISGQGTEAPVVGASNLDAEELPAVESQLAEVSADQALQTQADACAAGDQSACEGLLNELANECEEGYGLSCDWLYKLSEVGSPYEAYGATCGGRVDAVNAGSCADLGE